MSEASKAITVHFKPAIVKYIDTDMEETVRRNDEDEDAGNKTQHET